MNTSTPKKLCRELCRKLCRRSKATISIKRVEYVFRLRKRVRVGASVMSDATLKRILKRRLKRHT